MSERQIRIIVLIIECVVGGFLATRVVYWHEKYIVPRLKKQHRPILNHAVIYLMTQLEKLYFCGYLMTEVYCKHLLQRLGHFCDFGLCAPSTGMTMLALKSNRTARYVRADIDEEGEKYQHCWAEFRYCGIWWVVDPCWLEAFLQPRRWYYQTFKPKIICTKGHKEFWSYPISEQFYEKMQHPESSWLLGELIQAYGFGAEDDDKLFDPEIEKIILGEQNGYHLSPLIHYYYPKLLISRRVVHELMLRPERKHLKMHRVRCVRRYHRIVKQAYENWLRENHPEELAS